MAGSIAEAFYGGVPKEISEIVLSKLPPDIIEVITEFSTKYERR
jgi:ADP-ribosylglycohydrolase